MKRPVFILAILFYCTVLVAIGTLKTNETNHFKQCIAPEENTTFYLLLPSQPGPIVTPTDQITPGSSFDEALGVFAGNDTTICLSNQWFPLNGSAANYWFVFWSTAGDGFFSDANSLNANYFPGSNDKINGQVRLFLTIYQSPPDFQFLTDTVNITMVLAPESNAGPNYTICETDFFQVTGQACNYSSILWTTAGDGYFSNPLLKDVIYFPGPLDIAEGNAVLCLIALPNSPCVLPSANCMTLHIQKIPVIENLTDTATCSGSSIQLQPLVYYCDSVFWTTSGDGHFCNPFIVSARYFPGEQDILNGQAELQLSAISGCVSNQNVNASLILTIQPHPQVYQGPNQIVCIGDTIRLSGGGSNYSSIHWQSYGDGYFDDPSILNPYYLPGAIDIERGMVFLEIIAVAINPCNFFAGSYIEVTILGNAKANAGDDQIGCEQIQLSATACNYESVIWTTSGDGTFSDMNILNPSYHAGAEDLLNEEIQLTITALPISPCSVSHSDQLTFFTDKPHINSGTIGDQTVNAGGSVEMGIIIQTFSQGVFEWFHNDFPIPNSNSTALLLNQVSKSDAGTYYCEFENSCEKIRSSTGLLSILEPVNQEFELSSGWSSISSFVSPSNPAVATIFQPIIDQLVIVMNFEGAYWPDANMNTLGEWDIETGYSIKLEGEGQFTINGLIKYPFDPVLIHPGWSFIPVKSPCPIAVEETFGNYSDIVLIKEVSGTGVFWPAMQINTLEFLVPGKSYHVFKSGDGSLEVVLPDCPD